MADQLPLARLLGLPLEEARRLLAQVGQEPLVLKSAPERSRQFKAFPPEDTWRVARARRSGERVELVVTPALPLPSTEPTGVPEENR